MKKHKRKKNLFYLISGKFVTSLGDRFFDFGNNTWMTSLSSKGQKLITIYQISESVAGILLNLIGGVLADNYNRKKILVTTDIICGISCLLLAASFPYKIFVYLMISINILLATMGSFNSPAYKAIIPNIVDKTDIIETNRILEVINQIVNISSPALSFVAIKFLGIQGTLCFDGLSFIISALLNYKMKVKNLTKDHKRGKTNFKKIISEMFNGMIYIVHNKNIFLLLLLSSSVNFFLSGYNLSFPFSNTTFNTGASTYAKLIVGQSIGGILGALASKKLSRKKYVSLSIILALSGISVIMITLSFALTKKLLPVFVSILLFHGFLSVYNIIFFSIIQSDVKNEYLGRVFSVIFTIAVLFMPLGTLCFSSLFKATDRTIYLVSGLGIFLTSIIFVFLFKIVERNKNEIR